MRRPTILATIFTVAFLARAVAILVTGGGEIGFGDAPDYLAAARTICTEGDYPSRGNLPFFRAPGLPSFLAIATGCRPERVLRAKLAIALVDSLLPLLVFSLALALTGRPSVALLAALAAAFHPGLIYQTTDIRSEPLFTVMLTASLASFVLARRAARDPLFFAAGAAAAMAALIRPVGLVAIAFFAAASLARRLPFRRRLAAALLVAAGAAAALAPWTAFMARKHGELILVNDAGGYNLWRGSHPALYRALTTESRAEYRARSLEFELEISPREAASIESAARTPMKRSAEWRRRAIGIARSDPGLFARYTVWKAADFWQPSLNRFEYPPKVVWGSAAFNVALYALALGGIALLWRSDRSTSLLLVAWIATFWLAHVPFQVVSRFRTASLEPVLLLLAAIAVDAFLKKRRAALRNHPLESRRRSS